MMRKICWFIWKVWGRLSTPLRFRWRRLGLYARGVQYGPNLLVEAGTTIDGTGAVELGRDVWLGRGTYIHVWPGARLVIEDDTYIGRGTIILAHSSVRIGPHVMVAPYCHITDVNHGTAPEVPMRKQPLESRPVELGPDVWLGAGCSVLPGVRIGRGCVVGARAVVTRDLPDGAIAVGVPAKPVKFRFPPAAAE